MSEDTPARLLTRVLQRTGLSFPRGVLGEETALLATAMTGPGRATADLDAMVTSAAAALWPELQPSTAAALRRHRTSAGLGDVEDLAIALAWAEDPDPANPLARALSVRAAQELGQAVERAGEALRGAEIAVAQGGAGAAVAAAGAAGTMAVELLDLDPEDFGPEIMAYVDAGETAEALDELARATGDDETRAWARSSVGAVVRPDDAPHATAAVQQLAAGPPPEDPAEDAIWVPTVLALVEVAFERALTQG